MILLLVLVSPRPAGDREWRGTQRGWTLACAPGAASRIKKGIPGLPVPRSPKRVVSCLWGAAHALRVCRVIKTGCLPVPNWHQPAARCAVTRLLRRIKKGFPGLPVPRSRNWDCLSLCRVCAILLTAAGRRYFAGFEARARAAAPVATPRCTSVQRDAPLAHHTDSGVRRSAWQQSQRALAVGFDIRPRSGAVADTCRPHGRRPDRRNAASKRHAALAHRECRPAPCRHRPGRSGAGSRAQRPPARAPGRPCARGCSAFHGRLGCGETGRCSAASQWLLLAKRVAVGKGMARAPGPGCGIVADDTAQVLQAGAPGVGDDLRAAFALLAALAIPPGRVGIGGQARQGPVEHAGCSRLSKKTSPARRPWLRGPSGRSAG